VNTQSSVLETVAAIREFNEACHKEDKPDHWIRRVGDCPGGNYARRERALLALIKKHGWTIALLCAAVLKMDGSLDERYGIFYEICEFSDEYWF
jgi:hypothetical protein